MSITVLHEHIISEQGSIFSSPAGDTGGLLAESFDMFHRFKIYPALQKAILHVFSYRTNEVWRLVVDGELSLLEALHQDRVQGIHPRQSYVLWDTISMELNAIAPVGFRFVTRGDQVGWVQDREPVELPQILAWMHEQEPSKGFTKAVSNDALYLLDTLYEWKDRGIPVPYSYFEFLQDIVNSHKVGEGL